MINKIALLTDGIFPYVIGGMQKHSFYLAKYFTSKGIYVDIYHTHPSPHEINTLDQFLPSEQPFIHPVVVPFPQKGRMPGHYVRESFEYSIRLYEELRKRPAVDFIYAKGFTAWKLLDARAKGEKFPRIGVNFHGFEMFQKPPSLKAKLEQYLLRPPVMFCIKKADYVFSYGGKITDIILSLGIDREKIIEVPTGIEPGWLTETVQPAGKTLKFLFVGRFERRKGVEELTDVLKEIIGKYDFEFHFAGPIPVNKRIISPRVIYHGQVSEAHKMKELMRNCDILVCPSHSEGMPNVIMEAMASGLSVIASDVGAVRLMVNERTGWLITPGDRGQLKDRIVKAIESTPALTINQKKQEAVALVKEQFLWGKIIDTILAHISR